VKRIESLFISSDIILVVFTRTDDCTLAARVSVVDHIILINSNLLQKRTVETTANEKEKNDHSRVNLRTMTVLMLWHAFLFLGLRFLPPISFLAWWSSLGFLVKIFSRFAYKDLS
jgi:Na+/pantothenate symporter